MAHDNPNDPMGHELWSAFVRFSESQGVKQGDSRWEWGWQFWWNIFLAGAAAQFQFSAVGEC